MWGTWWGGIGQTPAPPSGLAATALSSTEIDVAWTDASSNETGFKIERKTGAGGTFTEIATVGMNVTAYSDTGLTANTEYFYRVRAASPVGDSDYSAEASATTEGASCTISCPSNVSVPADAGACSAVVTYTTPSAAGCGGSATVTCEPASGSTFPVGVTTVTCTVNGVTETVECTFTVTVADVEAPVVSCPPDLTVQATAAGGATVTYPTPTASDNCSVASVTCTPASGTTFAIGTTTVTCTATDGSNETATCSFTVTVDLMANGGFEAGGANWTQQLPGLITNDASQAARSGLWRAQLLGTGAATSQYVQQQPYFPSGGGARTLRFYLKIVTAEPGSGADKLTIRVMNTNNQVVANLQTITTAQAATYANYQLVTVALPAANAVPGYRIRFGATENASLATTFLVDDVSVQ
jgi:hypothetical protein